MVATAPALFVLSGTLSSAVLCSGRWTPLRCSHWLPCWPPAGLSNARQGRRQWVDRLGVPPGSLHGRDSHLGPPPQPQLFLGSSSVFSTHSCSWRAVASHSAGWLYLSLQIHKLGILKNTSGSHE